MSDRSATSHDREFEMVLDNKKLFSILFLTFVLLGVFFAMGYVLGRNSAPVETAVRPAPAPADSGVPAPRPPASGNRSEPESRPASLPEASAPQPAAPVENTARQQSPEIPAPASGTIIEPEPGQTFLQVSAVGRPEAELLVDVLVKKGFRAAVAAGPNERLYRVLVGPGASESDLAKMKSDLEQAGFKPIPRRY